jgi:hypothetical protein
MANIKMQYATAQYVTADGLTTGAKTLATTSIIPLGAIVTRCIVVAQTACTSGGAATLQVSVGGAPINTAIALAKLDTAGWVYAEQLQDLISVTADNSAISVIVAGAAYTTQMDLAIVVEYFQLA